MKQATGLIMEGIPATGKSTLIQNISSHQAVCNRDFMTFFTYGEEITQRVLEKKHNQDRITKQDNLDLLNEIVGPLESYQNYYQTRWSEVDGYRFGFILERFHLTHVSYFDYLNWNDVAEFDRKLARLNGKLCLLTMNKEVMKERIIYSRGQKWRDYISRFGETESEIIDHYLNVQRKKKYLAAKSSLSVLTLDTSWSKCDSLTEEIINFWGI